MVQIKFEDGSSIDFYAIMQHSPQGIIPTYSLTSQNGAGETEILWEGDSLEEGMKEFSDYASAAADIESQQQFIIAEYIAKQTATGRIH